MERKKKTLIKFSKAATQTFFCGVYTCNSFFANWVLVINETSIPTCFPPFTAFSMFFVSNLFLWLTLFPMICGLFSFLSTFFVLSLWLCYAFCVYAYVLPKKHWIEEAWRLFQEVWQIFEKPVFHNRALYWHCNFQSQGFADLIFQHCSYSCLLEFEICGKVCS